MPDKIPEDISNRISEDMPDRMTEGIQIECQIKYQIKNLKYIK